MTNSSMADTGIPFAVSPDIWQMSRDTAREIAQQWMMPTEGSSYMGGLEERPILTASHGATVTDTDGNSYLDFQSGQMGAALGHQHPRMVKRITETMQTMMHSTNTMLNVPRLRLHRRLGEILPKPLEKSVFLVSGSDSIEGAIDLARKATGGMDVIGLHAGLHGSTSFISRSVSFAWNRKKHAVAPGTQAILAPYCYRCPLSLSFPGCKLQCLTTSMELADANFTGKPAAFIGEPLLSAGGVIVPPPGYYSALQEELRKREMLMIFDEAQTGLGKTGKLFGFQHEGVVPDIIALSKHFGGGLPISAVCTTAEIAERAVKAGYFATRSHATDPLLCAAGEESIDIVIEEDMAGRAAAHENRMKTALEAMAQEFELIGDIRGRGVIIGIELVTNRHTRDPADAQARQINDYCQSKGLIFQLRGVGGRRNVIRIVPPMTTTDAEIDRGMAILHDALRLASASAPRQAAD
jgi:2,2-dialkylglycine decarboxylase (pyruvate)